VCNLPRLTNRKEGQGVVGLAKRDRGSESASHVLKAREQVFKEEHRGLIVFWKDG